MAPRRFATGEATEVVGGTLERDEGFYAVDERPVVLALRELQPLDHEQIWSSISRASFLLDVLARSWAAASCRIASRESSDANACARSSFADADATSPQRIPPRLSR